jgi:hypothetical protein
MDGAGITRILRQGDDYVASYLRLYTYTHTIVCENEKKVRWLFKRWSLS